MGAGPSRIPSAYCFVPCSTHRKTAFIEAVRIVLQYNAHTLSMQICHNIAKKDCPISESILYIEFSCTRSVLIQYSSCECGCEIEHPVSAWNLNHIGLNGWRIHNRTRCGNQMPIIPGVFCSKRDRMVHPIPSSHIWGKKKRTPRVIPGVCLYFEVYRLFIQISVSPPRHVGRKSTCRLLKCAFATKFAW